MGGQVECACDCLGTHHYYSLATTGGVSTNCWRSDLFSVVVRSLCPARCPGRGVVEYFFALRSAADRKSSCKLMTGGVDGKRGATRSSAGVRPNKLKKKKGKKKRRCLRTT